MKLLLPSLVLVSLLALGTMDVKSAEAKTLELDGFSFEIPKGCESEQEENRFATDTANLDCGDNREMVFEVGTFEWAHIRQEMRR